MSFSNHLSTFWCGTYLKARFPSQSIIKWYSTMPNDDKIITALKLLHQDKVQCADCISSNSFFFFHRIAKICCHPSFAIQFSTAGRGCVSAFINSYFTYVLQSLKIYIHRMFLRRWCVNGRLLPTVESIDSFFCVWHIGSGDCSCACSESRHRQHPHEDTLWVVRETSAYSRMH